MSGRQTLGRATLIPVRISEGETVNVTARLVFSDDGALLRVLAPAPGAGRADPREFAARRLLARLDAELARPGGVGMHALRQEAELLLALTEQLEAAEVRLGPVLARAQRMAQA
ncbi:MAG: hypothetical protein ACKVQR_04505 [Aquabacterium sp.]